MTTPSAKPGWGAAWAATLFIFCLSADQILMPLATASVAEDLGTNLRMVQIAIVLASLVAAPLYITGNKLGDVHGRRKIFLIGVILFTMGPISAVLTPNAAGLIAGWSITKGLGMVLAVPASIGMLVASYPDDAQRRRAFALYGAGGVAAALASPVMMGISRQIASWRVPYGFLILILLLALLLTTRSMQETERVEGAKVDWVGTVLAFVAIAAVLGAALLVALPFLLNLVTALFLLIAGVVVTAVFLIRARKVEEAGGQPMFSTRLLQNRTYAVGWGAAVLAVILSGAMTFTIPVITEQALGFNVLQSALVIFFFAAGSTIFAFLADRLLAQIAPRTMIQIFLGVIIVGLLWLAFVADVQMTVMTFLLPMFVMGAGFGVVGAQLPNLQMADLLPELHNDGGGAAEIGKELGIGLGTAVIGSIMFNLAIRSFVDNFAGWSTLQQVSRAAFVDGFQMAMVALAGMMLLALLLASFLPKTTAEAVRAAAVREAVADVTSKRV